VIDGSAPGHAPDNGDVAFLGHVKVDLVVGVLEPADNDSGGILPERHVVVIERGYAHDPGVG
jgi:hypothetical protein